MGSENCGGRCDAMGGEDLVPATKTMGTEGPWPGDAMRGYGGIHGNKDNERPTTSD